MRASMQAFITMMLCISFLVNAAPASVVWAQVGSSGESSNELQQRTEMSPNETDDNRGANTGSPANQMFLPVIRVADTAKPSAATPICQVYPIAVSTESLVGKAPGTQISDILNGDGSGDFGWLAWTGNTDVSTLIASLTPPGDSSTYINPDNPADNVISIGDWMRARPGIANTRGVRAALDRLKQQDITVPVWDSATGTGVNGRYRVVSFARIRLLDYRLPGQNRISIRFLGNEPGCSTNVTPVAFDDIFTVDEDTSLTVSEPGVLGNDTDEDGDSLAAVLMALPAHGMVDLHTNGSFLYTPPVDFHGTDGFTYQANDGIGNSNTATVTIAVQPVNDAPLAVNDAFETDEDSPVTLTVLANDSDADDDELRVVANSNPAHGMATANSDHTVTYAPYTNYCGLDSFSYTISDGHNGTTIATVTIDVVCVNDPPQVNNDTVNTAKNVAVLIDAFSNDYDPDGDALTIKQISAPSHGTAVTTTNSTIRYTPETGFSGQDAFTYTACDPYNSCATATVQASVGSTNAPPIAADDSVVTPEDDDVTIDVPANDSDEDGNLDRASVVILVSPAFGSLTDLGDGRFVYAPQSNFNDTDSFIYQICDEEALCDSATVTITVTPVNDMPEAKVDDYAVTEDTLLTVPAPGVLANDSDVDGDTLFVATHSEPSHGTLTQDSDGALTYTPQDNYCGTDSYTYSVSDGNGGGNSATVAITVECVNDAPIGVADDYQTDEDVARMVNARGLLDNDSDVDGDALSAVIVTGPSYGLLSLKTDGSLTYTPTANFHGVDSFIYMASDGVANSDEVAVRITVDPVNDVPVASADIYTTSQDVTLLIDAPGVLANDMDVDGDELTAIVLTLPVHGALELRADGSLTYTPTVGFSGADSFTYTVFDGAAESSVTTVTLVVRPVGITNRAPIASPDRYSH